jgi:ribose transport system permease protein
MGEPMPRWQASLGIGEPYLFQSLAAAVTGGVYIAGRRGPISAPWRASLVALVSVLMALNMPEYCHSITCGVLILLLLLIYGRESLED